MINIVKEQNIALNQIYKKQSELYHNYAVRYGFSDVAFWVLYSLCETDEVYTQNALAEMWCFPKQTVNSAISSLVKTGYIKLEQIAVARNSKAVKLTEQGSAICASIIIPLIEAEQRALLKMTDTERNMFIALSEKQYKLFQSEIDTIYQNSESVSKLETDTEGGNQLK